MNWERNRNECLGKLVWATEQLGVAIAQDELEKIAEVIVQTMTGPWRYFHTPDHIFEVGGHEDPIEVLAALFHDLVYVQVDRSVNFNLTYFIAPFIRESRESLVIRDREELPDDLYFNLVADLFGFAPGQTLSPFGGMNEFLSALAGAKILEPFFSRELISKIVVCIEGTIPFRKPDAEGRNCFDVLEDRLILARDRFDLALSDEEIEATVTRAVRIANRDVGSFANPSSARFLDNTWSLLPETNHNLNFGVSYTVHQYRIALQKMEGFMSFLQPEAIFHQYRSEPDDATLQGCIDRARVNIEIARIYLGSKLATIALLEALSLRFGKDIPLSMLMGEMPTEGFSVSVLADFLPDPPANPHQPRNELEREVLTLLEKGRLQEFAYDIKNSPLATFMVKAMGFDAICHLRDRGKAFFKGEISGEELLNEADPGVLTTIVDGLGKLFDSRKGAVSRVKLLAQPATSNAIA